MTKLTPDMTCESCGGMLVLPQIASGVKIPKGTDYVCLKCGRPYRWIGDPPRLATVPVAVVSDEETDDDE